MAACMRDEEAADDRTRSRRGRRGRAMPCVWGRLSAGDERRGSRDGRRRRTRAYDDDADGRVRGGTTIGNGGALALRGVGVDKGVPSRGGASSRGPEAEVEAGIEVMAEAGFEAGNGGILAGGLDTMVKVLNNCH